MEAKGPRNPAATVRLLSKGYVMQKPFHLAGTVIKDVPFRIVEARLNGKRYHVSYNISPLWAEKSGRPPSEKLKTIEEHEKHFLSAVAPHLDELSRMHPLEFHQKYIAPAYEERLKTLGDTPEVSLAMASTGADLLSWEMASRLQAKPIYQLIKESEYGNLLVDKAKIKEEVPLMHTVGANDTMETVMTQLQKHFGYTSRSLKEAPVYLKIKAGPEQDPVNRIASFLRSKDLPTCELVVDSNEAFGDRKTFGKFVKELERELSKAELNRIHFMEQPLTRNFSRKAKDHPDFRGLPVTVGADEGAIHPSQVQAMAKTGTRALIIKIEKGGLTHVLQMMGEARKQGITHVNLGDLTRTNHPLMFMTWLSAAMKPAGDTPLESNARHNYRGHNAHVSSVLGPDAKYILEVNNGIVPVNPHFHEGLGFGLTQNIRGFKELYKTS